MRRFVDPRQRGAIEVTKTRKHAASGPRNHPHSGVSFTVNGVSQVTDAHGKVCFDGLLFGSYSVTGTLPANYAADGPLIKTVVVNNKASCTDSPYVGETVAFGNTPLSTITVSFTSQVAGSRAARISCTGVGRDAAGRHAERLRAQRSPGYASARLGIVRLMPQA